MKSPSEVNEKSPTQGSKKRKKKHDDSDTGIVAAGLGADNMQPIQRSGGPTGCPQAHLARETQGGPHSIPPNHILDPCEVWRAREADIAHVDVLMTSFQQTMKMNSHGVLLVLQDNDLWATYSALNTPLQSAAMEEDSPFVKKCVTQLTLTPQLCARAARKGLVFAVSVVRLPE